MVRNPNFFIIGAPKCGTTSLYEALRRQSSVFMPHDPQHYWLAKEPNYFCPELIERYQRYFAPEQIKVLLLQDLAQQPQMTLNDVLNFLGLPDALSERLEVHNPRTQLHQGELLKHRLKNWLRGFGIVRAAIKFMPIDFDRVLGRILRPAMSRKVVGSTAALNFLAELRGQMRPEVQRLSQLIGRDLSHWEMDAAINPRTAGPLDSN